LQVLKIVTHQNDTRKSAGLRDYQNKCNPSSFTSEVKVQKTGHGSCSSHN